MLYEVITIKTPLDIHTDNPPGSGGFIRAYEAPEIVRVAAPLHCKTGNSVIGGHGEMTGAAEGKRMADQATIIVEMINNRITSYNVCYTKLLRKLPSPA